MRLYLPNGLLKRGDADISDLTTAERTGEPDRWDPDEADWLIVSLDREPSASEAEAIQRRLVTADDADEAALYALLDERATASTPFEQRFYDTELGKYGEYP